MFAAPRDDRDSGTSGITLLYDINDMKNRANNQHPYIGDIDIDWEEEKRRQKELNWERYEEDSWKLEQDMMEYDNRAFNDMIDDYDAWGNID